MGGCSSFMTPEELAQIRADYRKARWLMTEGRDNIVKAAVEWYDATLRETDAALDRADDLTIGKCVNEVWKAREALKDAVKRWKEAQA